MKRLKIMKAYAVLWLFIYFLVYSNSEAMATFFFATLTFNLAVLTILVIGIIVILKASVNLVMLAGTFGTLAYKKNNLTFYLQGIEKIMPANIAHMFHSRAEKGVLLFTSEESRTVIEWIDEKFSHQNRYINYFISTSLMIGLLGTFTGLLVSIDQMGKIILSLSGDIDLGEVIAQFAGPLGGMAIGFGSSLFGVVSAIILGIMGYILNKNQEVLVEGVEDWLKGRIIDSGGATASAGMPTGAGGELPEHRSSFMDVFIDNIASLTQEMAKISVTNERLHSITIASVQQTRDEHEVNFELFESMNDNLSNIAKVFTTNTELLSALDTSLKEQIEILNTLDATQKESNSKTDETKERLEALREELQNISKILSNNEELSAQNIQDVISSIASLSEKLQGETALLESLEKLQKLQISDGRKQTQVMESIESTSAQSKEETSLVAQRIESLEEALKQQSQDGTSLVTQSIGSLEESLKQQSQNGTGQVTQSIQSLEESLSQQSKDGTSLVAQRMESLEELLKLQSQEKTSLVTQKIETLEKLLKIQNQSQEQSLLNQDASTNLLEKQRSILELLVGKNESDLRDLKRISTDEPDTQSQAKSRGFFSKLFG